MNMHEPARGAPNACSCGAYGCPLRGTLLRGNVWLCAHHHFVRDVECWPAVTTWLRAHSWAFNMLARVAAMDLYDFDDTGPRKLWRAVAEFCEKHERPDLAPRTVELRDYFRDVRTGTHSERVRQRDERNHPRLWFNRVSQALVRECLVQAERRRTLKPSADPAPAYSEVTDDDDR